MFIPCVLVYSLVLAKCIINYITRQDKKAKRPELSPYRISKTGLVKLEFGKRFKVDIDAEFCKY